MNDNVGEMPIEIFGDYVSDCLDIEFPWEYLALVSNGDPHHGIASGDNDTVHDIKGNGEDFQYANELQEWENQMAFFSFHDWMGQQDIGLGFGYGRYGNGAIGHESYGHGANHNNI